MEVDGNGGGCVWKKVQIETKLHLLPPCTNPHLCLLRESFTTRERSAE